MKTNLITLALLTFAFSVSAQKYDFQTLKDIETEPVQAQGITGTCWSFSSTSFLEAEILRINGKKIDLSEMYNVRHTYPKKAWNYLMRQGKAQFGEGGLNHDVINSAKIAGLVPQSVFSGYPNGTNKYDHSKMAEELETLLKKYANPEVQLDPKWKTEVNAILDQYIGKEVTEFTFEGKKYTPMSFLKMTQLKLEDYVPISSFTHEPFYKKFILDVPDNFSNGSFYNLPLEEFILNIDFALEKGYTLALDADVSEKTFSSKHGIAVIPENESDATLILTEIKSEKAITPEFRQQEFENYNTTDDHLMHIVGIVKDQKNNKYYKVKNSWGKDEKHIGNGGYIYMSVPYMKLKAISVLLHKNALTKKTKKALKL
ncbi:C1 family peptidase [Flavobacterium sp.]|uniref:C1 family peptidase n=1 Tax=Flavobacterium sp. TaxID=239 RepID=UPI00260864B6|nr:C1 family peptidase [Flavobacterium sp.]MDD3003524.1 C1 family peptidase [Flavobacterium sp.]